MTKLIQTSALAILGAFVLGSTAVADDMDQAEPVAETSTKEAQTQSMTLRTAIESEVRGAIARGDMVAVEGPDGRIYYNRFIAIEDLPDPELDLRVIDTVDVIYQGTTFKNKIVEETN